MGYANPLNNSIQFERTTVSGIELTKVYDPSSVEEKWYATWENSGKFSPDINSEQESFTIMIPPPNVTGILTIGHVLNNTIQDVLIRRARMQGKNTLWLPGTDHASIATEAKVTKMLKDQGTDKLKIGREEFLKHAWEWKEKYGGTIIKQLKKLGCSCDWSREKFTMDEDYSNAVLECFVRLYNDGLIYRGERIINWDPVGLTALSEEEVIYKETQGHLWHFRYPIKDSEEYLIVATTRPETMLGDTGVAVNPKDGRYSGLVGKTVILPIVNREIPIFADEFVDMEFGTGCVKVTPAHDPNDFMMGETHQLEIINVMHPNATMNENTPSQYHGLTRDEAREKVVEEIKSLGLFEKIEEYTHNIGYSERTDAVVEPYLSKQWFLKMKPLAEKALKAVEDDNVKFYPDRWVKTYNHWLGNIRDWCISRQLLWGHRIPVWYKNEEIYCGLNPPDGDGWKQDQDVLDTWFSSWLWPIATLGWPKKSNDLKTFYPTQDLVTGPDIIFFWVARMIMAGLYFEDEIPFTNVYFTGIVRDKLGRKMSKSLGNSPDPLDLIEQFGADALRVGMLLIAPQGSDILFTEDRIEQGRNFMNKLWNSARFVQMNLDGPPDELVFGSTKLDKTDLWIISRLNNTIENVDNAYAQYRLNEAVKLVYDFVWSDFCDWYIEFSKTRLYGENESDKNTARSVAVYVLKSILKLLHPYTPFITEEIWSTICRDEAILLTANWPESDADKIQPQIEKEIQIIMDVISSLRTVKTNLSISPGKKISIFVRGQSTSTEILTSHKDYLERLVKVESIEVGESIEKPGQSATAVVHDLEIFIPLSGLIDIKKERKRLRSQIEDMKGRLNAVNGKLNNENFVNRAPGNVVNHEKEKFKKYSSALSKLEENFNSLS